MKKLLAILLVGIMIVALTACGGNETSSPSDADNNSVTTQDNVSEITDDTSLKEDDTEKGESILGIDGEFTAKQIEFIDSLGKSEEGKRLVCYNLENGNVLFHIAEWNDDGTLKSLTDYTIYYTNASYTAIERYEKEMEEHQKNWDLYEANNIDPATALAVFKKKSEELCMTSVDRTESSYADMFPMYETYEDLANGLYQKAIIVK